MAKQKAFAAGGWTGHVRWRLFPARRNTPIFIKSFLLRAQGAKDVADADPAWTTLIAIGLLWPWIGWLGLGHLPGDIVVGRKNFTLYVPIATGLLISVALTLLLWLVNW